MSQQTTSTSKVFFAMSMSLDGYVAPAGMKLEHIADPSYKNWGSQWVALQSWAFTQRFFRENQKLGEGGESGPDDEMLRGTFERTGATVLGKRMFDGGERVWPENAPFHTPVFVVTHTRRAPWARPGGTIFHFVDDGIQSALAQARAAAGGRDVRIGGGANLIQQCLRAGLVDEFTISVSPILLGEGTPLFEGLDFGAVSLTAHDAISSPRVTHLRYTVNQAPAKV